MHDLLLALAKVVEAHAMVRDLLPCEKLADSGQTCQEEQLARPGTEGPSDPGEYPWGRICEHCKQSVCLQWVSSYLTLVLHANLNRIFPPEGR